MSQQAYLLEATLDDDPDVRRTVAVHSNQTLADLHSVLRKAFGWHGDFPYTFRVGDALYTSPLTAELATRPPMFPSITLDSSRKPRSPIPSRSTTNGASPFQLEPDYDLGAGG